MDKVINGPIDLRDRSLTFSREVIRLAKSLETNTVSRPVLNQLVRSATSIGANFVEAKNSSSRKDFRNKVFISKKEASETMYWLCLLEEFTAAERLSYLKQECQEITMILQSITNTLHH